jgi:hypothetical protein
VQKYILVVLSILPHIPFRTGAQIPGDSPLCLYSLTWRVVQIAIGLTSPKSITHMFEN